MLPYDINKFGIVIINSGIKVISNNTIINIKTIGIISLNILFNGSLERPLVMKHNIPNGGVIPPIIIFTINITPKMDRITSQCSSHRNYKWDKYE